MPKQQIPERQPINDAFSGVISQFNNHTLLSADLIPSATVIAEGDFVIRYGIPYLGKPHLAVVPDLVVLDRGDMIVGEDAWEFLVKQSNLYPRADVLGYRHDGDDVMLVVKQLDFAIPFMVLAYTNQTDRNPIATLDAIIAPVHGDLPQRLTTYLPHYETLDDWQASYE